MRLWGRGDWRRGEHLCTHVLKRMAKRHGGSRYTSIGTHVRTGNRGWGTANAPTHRVCQELGHGPPDR